MTQRRALQTRDNLQCSTAGIMKDLITFICHHYKRMVIVVTFHVSSCLV